MQECTFEYSIIRVVPRVEREEFMNVGVVVSCPFQDFLEARVALDQQRLAAFAPHADFAVIDEYLRLIPLICAGGEGAGPIGRLPQRARFHWLVAPRSTMIQLSPVHSGLCWTPHDALAALFQKMVALPTRKESG